jgi:hypothetical protein
MLLQLGLDDLLGDLRHARRTGDLGRLALLGYCEVRRWARLAGEQRLAELSSALMTHTPHLDRDQFLAQVDSLIAELEQARARLGAESHGGNSAAPAEQAAKRTVNRPQSPDRQSR